MRGSPVRNFICVLILLLGMAAAVSLATRKSDETVKSSQLEALKKSDMVEVDLRMRFSHLPKKVSLILTGTETAVIDVSPTENYMDKTLSLPADQVSEFLLDIEWPEEDHAVYFAMITQRREGLEDMNVTLTSDDFIFSSVLTIDTGGNKP